VHALEKILAKASGQREVSPGEIITVAVDLAGINDLYPQVLHAFQEIGLPRVWDPAKVVFFLDHYAPAPTVKSATTHKQMREFAAAQGISQVFDINSGVCHQVLVEAGLSRPGKVVIITDSHSTTHGAVGAYGTGVGATDLAGILATGKTWMPVPEVLAFRIEGRMPPGVAAKDVILKIIGTWGPEVAAYKAAEYLGEAVCSMPLSERMALCNMAVEMGAETAYIEPDATVLKYIATRTGDYEVFQTDPGYRYAAEYALEISELEPQVALPHSIDNVVPITAAGRKRIHQGLIGTCTGGRVEDIAIAASILNGRRVASGTRLLIIPASTNVLLEAIAKGYIQALLAAGATLSTPGCGPCLGTHLGVIAPGEACVTSSSRNFPGRMGSAEGEVYVASPATVAASALTGYLEDPRAWMKTQDEKR
jgi:3-isopropylmalate/(R)-2-methylmalate dehydratase large subunit